jgi:hypothetical protein
VIGRSGIEFPAGPSVDDDPYGAWTNLAGALQDVQAKLLAFTGRDPGWG